MEAGNHICPSGGIISWPTLPLARYTRIQRSKNIVAFKALNPEQSIVPVANIVQIVLSRVARHDSQVSSRGHVLGRGEAKVMDIRESQEENRAGVIRL